MVDVFCSSCVSVPFPDVETKEGLIGVRLRSFDKAFEVAVEICNKILVEILSEKMCYNM